VIVAVAAILAIVLAVSQTLLEEASASGSIVLLIGSRVPEAPVVAFFVGSEVVPIVRLLVIVAVAAILPVVLAVPRTFLEVINNYGSILLPNGHRVPEALFVAVSVDAAVVSVSGLQVVAAVAAILTIMLAVPHALLEVINPFSSIVPLNIGRVPEALFVAVSIGTLVVRIAGLLVIAPVSAVLSIVLAVLHALLKGPSLSALVVVAIRILVAIMITVLLSGVLPCGSRGRNITYVEPGDGDSKCQHP
jgi:hypothetical protein